MQKKTERKVSKIKDNLNRSLKKKKGEQNVEQKPNENCYFYVGDHFGIFINIKDKIQNIIFTAAGKPLC